MPLLLQLLSYLQAKYYNSLIKEYPDTFSSCDKVKVQTSFTDSDEFSCELSMITAEVYTAFDAQIYEADVEAHMEATYHFKPTVNISGLS